jgi:hypothetical protein
MDPHNVTTPNIRKKSGFPDADLVTDSLHLQGYTTLCKYLNETKKLGVTELMMSQFVYNILLFMEVSMYVCVCVCVCECVSECVRVWEGCRRECMCICVRVCVCGILLPNIALSSLRFLTFLFSVLSQLDTIWQNTNITIYQIKNG